MPARLDLTPEEALERLERRRQQTRLAVQRYRARLKDAVSHTVSVTQNGVSLTAPVLHAHTNGHADARSLELEVTSSPTEKRENERTGAAQDFERVRVVLEPLPGYVHDEQLLARLEATCPAVDLVLEAIGMAEWLCRGPNQKRRCSKAFIANWVKRAAPAPVGRPAAQEPAERPRSALARVLEQIATSPVEGPSTWR